MKYRYYYKQKDLLNIQKVFFVGLLGLEPRMSGPESGVLPLHHSPILNANIQNFLKTQTSKK